MTLTLLMIWALSPLVLIPGVIVLAVMYNKAAKKSANLQQTLYQLMRLGRITEEEYHYMSQGEPFGVNGSGSDQGNWRGQYGQYTQSGPYGYSNQYSQPGQYDQSGGYSPQGEHGQTSFAAQDPPISQSPAASQSEPSWKWKAWEPNFQAAPPQPAQFQATSSQAAPPQPETGEQPVYQTSYKPAAAAGGFGSISPINGILIIGVLFIAIAGVIFATTTWQSLPDAARVIIILSGSLLFFGTSMLAKEKLDLPQTGLAFFILGSLFLPISIVGVSYFELFGDWFTLTGDGRFTVGFTAFLLLMIAGGVGMKLYSRIHFLWVSLPCSAICISCLCLQLYEAYDVLILVLSLYSTGFLLGVRRIIRERLENKEIYEVLENYAFIQIGVCGIGVLFIPVSGFVHFCAAVVFFILFLSPDANAEKFMKYGSGSYISSFFLIFSIFLLQPGREWMIPSLTLGAVILILLETSGFLTAEMKKPLGIAGFISIAVTAGAAIWYQPGWSIWMLLSTALLLAAVTVAGLRGRKAFLGVQPLILVVLFFGIIDLWVSWEYKELIMAGLCGAAFILYFFLRKEGAELLRTPFSDGIFFAFCFMANVPAFYDEAKLTILIISCIILTVITVRYSKIGYALPHLYLFSCYPFFGLLELDVDVIALSAYGIICLLGILMAFKKDHPISGVMQIPIMMFAGLYGILFTFLSYSISGNPFFDWFSLPGSLFFWVGAIYFTVCFFRGIYIAENAVASFYTAGAALLIAMLLGGRDFIPGQGLLWGIFIPATACCLLELLIRTRRVQNDTFLACHLPRLQAGGLQAAALFCILTFFAPAAIPANIQMEMVYNLLVCIVCGAAFLSLFRKEFSILTVIPTIGVLIYMNQLLYDSMMAAGMTNRFLLQQVIVFIFFSISGRAAFSRVIETEGDNKSGKLRSVRIDWLTIAAAVPAVFLITSQWDLFGWLLLAVYFLLFYDRGSYGMWNPLVLTLTSAALVFACWSQLDGLSWELMTLAKLLPPFAALQFAYWWTWKKHANAGHCLFGYSIFSVVWLLAEALLFSFETYALLIGVCSLVLIIFAYQMRNKRWFLFAAITLIVIGVYLSRSFWLSLGWWVYLLAAGSILVAFGAGNERAKRNGGGMRKKAGEFWKEWN